MVMNLLRHIDRSEIMFDFVVDHPERNHYEKEARSLGAKIYIMPAFRGTNLREIRKAWDRFFEEHPEYRILHSHVRSYASLYLPIAKKHGVKTIIHSHSTSNGKGIASVVKRILQYPLRYQADYLMACSNEAGRWLFGKNACKKNNYIFLPNAIDTEKYRFSGKTAAECRKEWGLEGKFVLGHVGRFHEAKNHMFLLKVFAGVAAAREDAVLLLVGDGELREEIVREIDRLGIGDRVILTGIRDDIPRLMQAMDLFVFPSLWEGLPVTVVEAQAAGLPCLISDRITTDVDVSELVKRLPIGHIQPWVQEVLHLEIKRISVTARIIEAGFDINDSVCRMAALYRQIGA